MKKVPRTTDAGLSWYLAILIPLAEASGEFKIQPTQEHFSFPEMPPTEVGGVSKFNL
jgi:hypothetical protein